MGLFLKGLHVYPVKSLAGQLFNNAFAEKRGLRWDRCWILVAAKAEDGTLGRYRMLTQRVLPEMVLLNASVEQEQLVVSAKSSEKVPALRLALKPDASQARIEVAIFNQVTTGKWVSEEADAWFSARLRQAVRLVIADEQQDRSLEFGYASADERVVYADGYPYLLATEASLEALNHAAGTNIEMRRFRPNLVIEGAEAFAEDQWRKIRIGENIFDLVKPCSRCSITSVEPATGSRHSTGTTEIGPLKALIQFRSPGKRGFLGAFSQEFFTLPEMSPLLGKPLFGQNAVIEREGFLQVGSKVEVLERW